MCSLHQLLRHPGGGCVARYVEAVHPQAGEEVLVKVRWEGGRGVGVGMYHLRFGFGLLKDRKELDALQTKGKALEKKKQMCVCK